ncbi:MAG: hypothetical protein M1834_005077 [Cirrosporium novae-zelandiae]|nr:MAG: hypothetical protein M1834_005077 [Cirrosporium novae-zelandiae]
MLHASPIFHVTLNLSKVTSGLIAHNVMPNRKLIPSFRDLTCDEYCPHCDNHFVIEALTPKPALKIEGEDVRKDARMLKDHRIRGEEERTIFNVKDAPNKLG